MDDMILERYSKVMSKMLQQGILDTLPVEFH